MEETIKKTHNYRLIAIFILLVILIGAGWWFFARESDEGRYITFENEETLTREVRTNLELGMKGRDLLPQNFPNNIPVELESVAESYVLYRPASGAQYIFSYLTDSSPEDKYSEYEEFMREEEYQLVENGNGVAEQGGALFGVKDGAELLVIVSVISTDQGSPERQNGVEGASISKDKTIVQIKYTDSSSTQAE